MKNLTANGRKRRQRGIYEWRRFEGTKNQDAHKPAVSGILVRKNTNSFFRLDSYSRRSELDGVVRWEALEAQTVPSEVEIFALVGRAPA